LAYRFSLNRSVADQTAIKDVLAKRVDGRNPVARRQCDEPVAVIEERRVGSEQQRAGTMPHEGREGGLELAFVAGVHNIDRLPQRARRHMHIVQLGVRQLIFRGRGDFFRG
jgi:hypothetical protein